MSAWGELRRLLHGSPEASTYWLTRFWFLRALGLVYVAAFGSLSGQLLPLLGSGGLTPVATRLQQMAPDGVTFEHWQAVPTLFWIDASDPVLVAACWVGLAVSLLLLFGLGNGPMLVILWMLYGSFVNVGQRWFSFGWESQLLETGLLAVFLASAWDPRPFAPATPSLPGIWAGRWLIARIMLGAGLIKLRGGACWTELTCLDYHFETQPIPGPLSPLFHALPRPMLHAGVLFNHVVELGLPWLLVFPRRVRHLAGAGMVGLQITLILSGNLSFLNFLTLVPCVACFDDQLLRRLSPRRIVSAARRAQEYAVQALWRRVPPYAYGAAVIWLSVPVVDNLLSEHQAMNTSYDVLRVVNTYGAFGSVGEERQELIIEGTMDADPATAHWEPYELPCKPGDPMRRPCIAAPYHYRLDWLMWFAGLEAERVERPRREAWIYTVLDKLLAGDPLIRQLLAEDPFHGAAPRFVRVLHYRYWFAPLGSDATWERELVRVYIPPRSRAE